MAKYIVVLQIETNEGDPELWNWEHSKGSIDVVCSVVA